jgi:hypothetical protein
MSRAGDVIATERFAYPGLPAVATQLGNTLVAVDKEEPGGSASLQNVIAAVPNARVEFVLAEVLPDILHRVEFGAIDWQMQQNDVVRHKNFTAGLMQAGAVADHHRAGTCGNLAADLGKMPVRGATRAPCHVLTMC